jgi:hypothetical protein
MRDAGSLRHTTADAERSRLTRRLKHRECQTREVSSWTASGYCGSVERDGWPLASRLENAVTYDRSHVGPTNIIVTAALMLTIASPTIAAAATIEEVAHCRAIQRRAERLDCFKSLKPGPKAKTSPAAPTKTEAAAPANADPALRTQDAVLSKMKDIARAKTKPVAPAKTEDASAKTEQAAPAKTGPAPANTEPAAAAKTEQAVPANIEEAAPAKLENPTKTGEASDPATTSSIDRLSVAGQPLCVDTDALAAMLTAGLLTSNPKKAATNGCQTLPEGAKLKLLERYPSVFPSMRIVRVKVTSPTQPDLTFGFTIEMGR